MFGADELTAAMDADFPESQIALAAVLNPRESRLRFDIGSRDPFPML